MAEDSTTIRIDLDIYLDILDLKNRDLRTVNDVLRALIKRYKETGGN